MALENVVVLLPETTGISADGVGDAKVGFHRDAAFFGQMTVSATPAGGTPTLDVYVQTSADGGTTWRDMAAFQFTGSQAKRFFQLSPLASPGASLLAESDGALASGTQVPGPIGDRLRVKYKFAQGGSAGTYTLKVTVVPADMV
jgi:hypothetical protein